MTSHLQWPDYLILAIFLAISLAIGLYHSLTGGRQKTTAEFIMADRRLKVIPTAISLLVSFHSAITLLGFSAEMYFYGIQLLIYICIAIPLGLVAVERIIVPWLYPLKLVSINEYLERRFLSRSVRIFGAFLGLMTSTLYMGVCMYAPSAALESATGLPLKVSIPVMAIVSITYTALGGMRAVIWTDVFQFLTMIGGITAIFVKGLIVVGGISNVFRLAGQEGRLVLANFSPDPRERHTVWSLSISMVFGFLSLYGLSQAAVQRISAVDKLSKARMTILINIPPAIIMNLLACFMGLIVLAFYANIKCDPLANKEIVSPNQVLPYFVVTIFAESPGFSGLFLSTLYGGSLSSVSSLLSGSAANFWEDILKWKYEKLTESRKALINRFLVVLFGLLGTGIAFLSASVPGPITQVIMAMYGSLGGPTLGIFFLGGVSKHANWKGTLLGGFVGLAFSLWLCIGSLTIPHVHRPLPPVSTEGCSVRMGNGTFTSDNYTSFFVNDTSSADIWNDTSIDQLWPRFNSHHKAELRGLENFYATSYLWFMPFGAIVTALIGIVASMVMRDRDLESKVDDRLLLRFRQCGECQQTETKEYLDDKSALEYELKVLKEADGLSKKPNPKDIPDIII